MKYYFCLFYQYIGNFDYCVNFMIDDSDFKRLCEYKDNFSNEKIKISLTKNLNFFEGTFGELLERFDYKEITEETYKYLVDIVDVGFPTPILDMINFLDGKYPGI